MKLKNNFSSKRINNKEFIKIELQFIILIVTRNIRFRIFIRKVSSIKKFKSIINY